MTVRENLIAARALIDTPEKWGKGLDSFTYDREELSCTACAHEALRRVVGKQWGRAIVAECKALQAALPDGFREVPVYNDHPETTHADIMALFDRAIAACEVAA